MKKKNGTSISPQSSMSLTTSSRNHSNRLSLLAKICLMKKQTVVRWSKTIRLKKIAVNGLASDK